MPELSAPSGEGGPPAVEVRSVSKVLSGRVRVLDGAELTVAPGQVMGLAGPNGSGKSTLLKVLLGLVRPNEGSVWIFGQPTGPGAPVLARVGVLVDGPGFLSYLSGRLNLELAQRANRARVSDDDLQTALGSTGLGEALDRPYRTYSHGMRYRLGLAMAMMGNPDLLLLDEPTTGLDPAQTDEVEAAIRARAASGTTVVLSSHDLGFLERLCSHAGFLVGGRIDGARPLSDLMAAGGSLRGAYLQVLDGVARLPSPAGRQR
ncbi:MAG: ABC transporter ATP-binding protein [Acidimicrobiales bacterium]